MCQWLLQTNNKSTCETVVVNVKRLSACQNGSEMNLTIMCYICFNIWDIENIAGNECHVWDVNFICQGKKKKKKNLVKWE